MTDFLRRLGVHTPVDLVVFVCALAVLALAWLALPGCGDSSASLQSAQLPVVTPTEDLGHTITGRSYTTWCAGSDTCISVITESIDSANLADWSVPPPTPMFPRERPPFVAPTPCDCAVVTP
jgi:hypothetical protein